MTTTKVKALVLTGFGLNCDHETAHACRLAGAETTIGHINALIDGSISLRDYQLMVFVGGFSWGDDHGAGVIQAVRMKTNLGGLLLEFIDQGSLVLGICNGFQTLVPGFEQDYTRRLVALTYNDCGNFRDDWVTLKINPASPCVFTRGMEQITLPIRHGEGTFFADQQILNRLSEAHQIALQYVSPDGQMAAGCFPHNPNGSLSDIAGICDPTGRVFGLMPHPEAYNHWTNHPDWTLHKEHARRGRAAVDTTGLAPGIRMFKNAVEYLEADIR